MVSVPGSGRRFLRGLSAPIALLAVAGFLGLDGCATGSTTINDPRRVATLRVGVTTIDEVRAMFGEPDDMQQSASGNVTFMYSAVNRNVIGTTISGVGYAAGTTLGTFGGMRLGRGFEIAGESTSAAVGAVVGGNIGKSADEKVHDQFKDEYPVRWSSPSPAAS